ncbi:uncharacterized protein MONBRDRAFT_35850 [Monosiga brevicollis MX1]|uniref:WW domain-containing protein n=1 Tax=Monosiga brevicollis TaxID=81824 RepID=A9US64_MONBE|nr:uncharacterized protein MONBRDRAFT_35850 [Monosiga brevicollis MX1]EDQ92047.1 predicted protein [Monosiga brevicollis MX1]|eukprot:XP_001743333.1 hypothetical protein [Monosiga brevicollis MX1]
MSASQGRVSGGGGDDTNARVPSGQHWQSHVASNGKTYFFNVKTKESRWEPPPGWTATDGRVNAVSSTAERDRPRHDRSMPGHPRSEHRGSTRPEHQHAAPRTHFRESGHALPPRGGPPHPSVSTHPPQHSHPHPHPHHRPAHGMHPERRPDFHPERDHFRNRTEPRMRADWSHGPSGAPVGHRGPPPPSSDYRSRRASDHRPHRPEHHLRPEAPPPPRGNPGSRHDQHSSAHTRGPPARAYPPPPSESDPHHRDGAKRTLSSESNAILPSKSSRSSLREDPPAARASLGAPPRSGTDLSTSTTSEAILSETQRSLCASKLASLRASLRQQILATRLDVLDYRVVAMEDMEF